MDKPRVLIIDDDPAILSVISRQLKKNYDVLAAGSVEQALIEIRKGFLPRVAIVDYMLPGLSGGDFIKDIPVDNCVPILITAKRLDAKFISDMMSRGAMYVLEKPFSFLELKAMISKIINDLEKSDGQASRS